MADGRAACERCGSLFARSRRFVFSPFHEIALCDGCHELAHERRWPCPQCQGADELTMRETEELSVIVCRRCRRHIEDNKYLAMVVFLGELRSE